MKVTKAQSQENRARVVKTASALFRERGYDGVSVADLMVEAGLTHGGFYKHFGSKADLMAEATAQGLDAKMGEYRNLGLAEVIQRYLSRDHRDGRAEGCTMAALCGDAPRQPDVVLASFAAGTARMLDAIERALTRTGQGKEAARARAISLFSQMLGAVMLSRACPDDSPLADEILVTCRQQILSELAPALPAMKQARVRR